MSCIIFNGLLTKDGYGKHPSGMERMAHRRAWSDANGDIPTGCVVMHSCDNPSCVNADHLSIGTQSENIKQAYAKGRKNTDVIVKTIRKLSDEDIQYIRTALSSAVRGTQSALARQFNVTRQTISDLARGNTWSDTSKETPQ